MRTLTTILLGSVTLAGCITVYTDQPSRSAPGSPPSPPTATQATVDKRTIAETIRICSAIQESKKIEMGCSFDYFRGKPVMTVSFPSAQYADNVSDTVANELAGPYCRAANDVNREGYLMLYFRDTKLASLMSCETGEASQPFVVDDK
jgi:hypothetical protein